MDTVTEIVMKKGTKIMIIYTPLSARPIISKLHIKNNV
jgi:hypothetical protein